MFKKVSTLLLIAVFMVTAVGFAGVKKESKKVVATESVVMSSEIAATSVKLAKSTPVVQTITAGPAEGVEIGVTDYDYGWNSGSPRYIATFDNGTKVHMTFMERDLSTGAAPANRRAHKYVFWDAANPTALVTAYPRPKATGASGFGGIDVIPAGAGAGIAVMVYHTPNQFAIDGSPGGGAFTESAIPLPLGGGALDPNITVSKDGNVLWYYDTYGRVDYKIGKSTDFGSSWTLIDTLMRYVPGFVQGALDVPILTASNGDLYLVTTIEGKGNLAPVDAPGAHPDSADRIGYFKSTNSGVNWTWTTIGRDGQALVVAPGDTVYPLFDNFGQFDAVLDGNNNLHVVANGYSLKMLTDSTASNRFYTLYWKQGQGWKIISNPAHGAYAEYDSSYYVRTGNAIGHSYPTVAVSNNGNILLSVWAQPIFNSGKLDTLGGLIQYQLWTSNSVNGGVTWTASAVIPNSVGGNFATLAEALTVSGNNVTGYMVYLADTARGTAVSSPGAGPAVKVPYVFRTFGFVTSVGGDAVSPNTFELAQNFPNPFNPATSIRYTIGKADNVSLKVYNMLGQEVATVVNQFQTAGSHSVTFDASNLASGMYLYKIQSGSFSEAKKMMLLK
jgi:hypothetical protein